MAPTCLLLLFLGFFFFLVVGAARAVSGTACSRLGGLAQLLLRPRLGFGLVNAGVVLVVLQMGVRLLVVVEQLRVEAGCQAIGEKAMHWELWHDKVVSVLRGVSVDAEEGCAHG
jgi:hypothetical protein